MRRLIDDPSWRPQIERVSLDDICVEPLGIHNEQIDTSQLPELSSQASARHLDPPQVGRQEVLHAIVGEWPAKKPRASAALPVHVRPVEEFVVPQNVAHREGGDF